jgi:tetratricopeptide (TPR) repeat protein
MKGIRLILIYVLCLCLVACVSEDVGGWKKLDHQAYQLLTQGEYEEGVIVAVQALDLAKKCFGPADPNVTISLVRLAGFYKRQRKHSEAEPLLQQALVITENARGPDHPDVAMVLNNLGTLYKQSPRPRD